VPATLAKQLCTEDLSYILMRILATAALITVLGTAQAQTETDSTLRTMNKVQLSNTYLEEVNRVTLKLIDTAWGDRSGTVPDTKYTQGKFKKVVAKQAAYTETLKAQLLELVPYADTDQLINAIIYLRKL